jgi:hypothetical protein
LNFCLSDGTQLLVSSPQIEQQTVLRPPPGIAGAPSPPRQGVHPVFAYLTVGVFALLIGGAIVVWLMYRGNEVTPANSSNQPTNAGRNENGDAKNRANTNGGNKSISNAPDMAAARSEVNIAFEGWVDTLVSHNLTDHLRYYDDKLDVYYKRTNVEYSAVRKLNDDLFNKYSTFGLRVTNLDIQVAPGGERALARFDSAYDFSGSAASYAGVSRTELSWRKVNGAWKITSERDLKNTVQRRSKQ